MFYVYVLQSLSNKRFYIGVTTDPERRVVEHNQSSTRSTRPFRPWVMIYKELVDDKSEAYKREYHLKHPQGYKEKLKIIEDNKINSVYGEVA